MPKNKCSARLKASPKGKPPQEWFKQAQYDLETAEAMFQTGRYIYAVFMCHLCIEKALKGLYTQELNDIPPKVHNLIYLIKRIDLSLPDSLKEFITELNRVSIPTRYPEELKVLLKEYNKRRVSGILKNTKETLKWLKKRLKQ
ncbi:MAG: DNA-binding protein [bacterium (Candidatus Ratteibacteria) CG_4_10_14_3_um_filter_41_18]|uniref:DNA-binding protein n=2 Tax=Candidatus Ratteibacteria TaxID=2979319 RepID=A0A2M7E8D5_9BACT|nr:MAG: DNA-binding protein [bacterium (Candidatus Ratteibacteria) CG01_land_8_20_14_3_00_40_19]PIX77922.1 MAG: DNA-binding protein [bacterium (Candidatus Ratteibacteria) CG_4_10_14_3_um_filter_41_18]HCG77017.1 DNA-binding protein [bacterium]